MKKYLLAVAVTGAILGSSAVMAAPNTITFQGEVSDQTCDVAVNGNTANPFVLLPTVAASELASAGAVAGKTSFEIALSSCDSAVTSSKVNFVGNSVLDGNLVNSGDATNVALQLLDTADVAINLNGVTSVDGPTDTAAATYGVQYVATGTATAGSVLSSVQYSVSYN